MTQKATHNLYTVLTVKDIIEEARDFKTFVFHDDHDLHYEAGQFLTLVHNSAHEEIRRSYSITSSPALNEPLSIGVRRITNGIFSRQLIDKTKVGDALLTSGVGGFFRLPEQMDPYKAIIFFAAGSGITPIISLLKTILHVHHSVNVKLLYSNSSPGYVPYHLILKQLENKFSDRFQIDYLFSTTPDLRKAHLNRDYIIRYWNDHNIDSLNTLFYVCGPESYMRMVTYVLHLQGVKDQNIRREDFVPNKKISAKLKPPDEGNYFVTLQYEDRQHKINVRYPDSILQAAKKEKLSLPYSCETGKCGNCAALCLSGEVWLSNNEVLTDKELKKGLTLTCVGHPINGDVILKMD